MSALQPGGLLANDLSGSSIAPALLGGKSCSRCQEIYSLLHNHIMQQHLADNDGRDTSILNNILLSILALLTTSNKLPEIPLAASAQPDKAPTAIQGSSENTSVFPPQISTGNQLPALRLLGTGSGVTSLTVPTIVSAGEPSHVGIPQQQLPLQKTELPSVLKTFLGDGQLSLKQLSQIGLPQHQQQQRNDQQPPVQQQQQPQLHSHASQVQPQLRDAVPNVSAPTDLQFGQDNLAHLDVLLKLLKATGQSQHAEHEDTVGTQSQTGSGPLPPVSLQMAKNLASTFPLLLSGQAGLSSDIIGMGSLQVPRQSEAVTSEKSDLDVADILVNRMPIPSISKGETETSLINLHNFYLKQLTLQQGLLQGNHSRALRESADGPQADGKIDLSSISLMPSSSTSSDKDPVSQGLENIAQIVAAQKQLTSLLSLIGKGKVDKTPPVPSKPELIETPLSNTLFSQPARSNIISSLPTVYPIPISNLFPSSSLVSQSTTVSSSPLPTMAFVSSATSTLSSLSSLHIPSILTSMTNTSLGQINMPLTNQASSAVFTLGGRPTPSVASNMSRMESVISPRTPTPKHTPNSLPSLAEHLFRTTTSRISTQESPQLFSMASVASTSVEDVHPNVSETKTDKAKDRLDFTKGPGMPILRVAGAEMIADPSLAGNNSVDKIQGLLNAARLTPQGSSAGLKGIGKHASDGSAGTAKRSKLEGQDGLRGIQKVSPRGSEKEKSKPKKLYKCDTCNVTFSVFSTLQAHQQIHLGAHMQCNYCYQVFSDAQQFQDHISLHRGEENVHHCQYCNRLFTSRGDLQKHLAEHTQKRPYKCKHCSKCFRDPGSLQKHERIHTGERPFNCSHCERAFAEYSSLRKHIRVHTGEQPYKCPQCPKAFSISGNLQRHLFIHTGERPYRCTKCPKAFNNPSHLRRHVKNLHDSKKGAGGLAKSNSVLKQDSIDNELDSVEDDDGKEEVAEA